MPEPRLISTGDAIKYCGVSREYLRANYPGRIIQIGSRLKWDIRILDRWIDAMSGLDSGTGNTIDPIKEYDWDDAD